MNPELLLQRHQYHHEIDRLELETLDGRVGRNLRAIDLSLLYDDFHDLLGDPIAVHDTFAQPHCLRAPMIGSRRFILGEWLTYEIPLVNAIGPRRLKTKGLDETDGGVVALDDPADDNPLGAAGAHAPPQLRKRRRGDPGSKQRVAMPGGDADERQAITTIALLAHAPEEFHPADGAGIWAEIGGNIEHIGDGQDEGRGLSAHVHEEAAVLEQ